MRNAWNDRLDVQAAWPVIEVRKLFAVVGNIDAALRIIAILVVVVALVGAFGWIALVDGDIDGSGIVNGADLALVLGSWGPCPE